MDRRDKKKQGQLRIVIIGDGESEKAYWNEFKRLSKQKLTSKKITIKPILPENNIQKQIKEIRTSLKEKYDLIFWLIDVDTLCKELKEGSTKNINFIKDIYNHKHKNFIKDIYNHKHKNIYFCMMNPCFEVWVLLHFEDTTQHFDRNVIV